MRKIGSFHTYCVLVLLASVATSARAQDASSAADPEPPVGLGDLDAMLGLEPSTDTPDRGTDSDNQALDVLEGELERALDGEAITQTFEDAVALMNDSAKRLGDRQDTGIDTQRMQAEAIRKLEVLIKNAQQQQQQSKSQQQQQQQQQQQNQPNQQQQQQQQQQGDNQQEIQPPGAQSGDLSRWGGLPTRLRDALLQGADERFSTLYRSMTERYFERLAEEAE